MPIQKSEAILLGKQNLRETSIILTFFTKESGKIRGIVRGVRGGSTQLGGGAYEVFSRDEIVYYERRRGDIFTISQCELINYFNPLRSSLDKLSYAMYLVELLDSVTALSDPNPEVFDLIVRSLTLLQEDISARRIARIFEIRLLSILGMLPPLDACVECGSAIGDEPRFSFSNGGVLCNTCRATDRISVPILQGTAKFIEHVRTLPFDKVARIKVAAKVGEELEAILRKFLDFHVERRFKSVKFLREIGAS